MNRQDPSQHGNGGAKKAQPKQAPVSKNVAPKTPALQARTAEAHAAVKAPRNQPPTSPSPVTPTTPKKPSSPKKVHILADDALIAMTCSVAKHASPRSTRVMENGLRRVVCCEYVFCEVGSFKPDRIGLGKHKGWKNYPKKCSGCKKFIREGKQQKDDEKNNITRCNSKRPTWMCKNAYNHRDDECVSCYCFDCREIVKHKENPDGSPTKKKDAKGRQVRTSGRKRTAANQLNPGEAMLISGEIVPAVPAKRGRKN